MNSEVMAYIDPGAGAMVVQWLIAGIVGFGFFFRRAIVAMFMRLTGKDKTTDEGPQADPKKASECDERDND